MKLFKRSCAVLLAVAVYISTLTSGIETVAAAVSGPKTTVLENAFVKVSVDNATGRFGIRTVDGQPIRKNDQNVDLMFRGDDPETSFTTFKIDGTDYIFGNPYKFGASFFSETTTPKIVNNPNGTKQIETIWSIKGVQIKQILMLYTDAKDKANVGNVNIRYEVLNNSGADVQLGSRILLDTMVGGNDGPQFQIGTTYRSPLTVERKLVHDPVAEGVSQEDEAYYKLPSYWVMRDKFNLNDPQATNVIAYGFNNIAEQGINIVDEMIVGHWNSIANTKWDYEPVGTLDFTRDTNDYGTADSAVAFYWMPDKIENKKAQSFETIYGLGEIVEPDKVFSIRYMDPVQQLATLPDNSAYVDEGVFKITAEIENLAMFDMKHKKVDVKLELESGLNFVRTDDKGQIVRENGKVVIEQARSKTLPKQNIATAEELENNIESTYKPGDTFTAEFYVQAKGRPWPTTRQYLLSVSSEATRMKLEGVEDEGIKAQYESTKSNFILLPPIGEAVPTYIYGVSPSEVYSSDDKYITVNLSNIEAYTTGDATTAPNFDLYLKESVTGDRYKVPVQSSVLMQITDDGFSGDMRITYREGVLVDEKGQPILDPEEDADRGPELPLGEYQVELDYKGDAGGDEEIAALYDITSEQTFVVSDNEEARIRQANLLALYKETVDLSGQSKGSTIDEELAEQLNTLFPGEPFEEGDSLFNELTSFVEAKYYLAAATKAIDPEFETGDYLDEDSLAETPIYQYRLFESDEEMEEFFEDEDFERESLVTVRGMIKEIGTGDEQSAIVDTRTEPAIINDAVAYKGKDMVFVRGNLDIFNMDSTLKQLPFLQTLFAKGEGTLSVASSGFVFHSGEWTLDFFNGFNKTLGEGYVLARGEIPESDDNEEDDSLNGSLRWAVGSLGDRLNPLRQVMLETVYFNRQSLFAPPSFTISGFGFTFNDFILREGGISFGGTLALKVIEGEVRNVIFNDKGFVGVDAGLKFDLNESMGLFEPSKEEDGEEEDEGAPKGEINVKHYVQKVDGVNNEYGVNFEADIKSIGVGVELAFKQVDDGRILPDVIGFSADFSQPGVLLTGGTYLTGIRGAVRELADTIAGGTKDDPFPLTVEAGVSLRFGVAPAYFHGDIDLTVKRTGIKVEGKMDFSTMSDPEDDDLLEMLTYALIEAQWVTPWFVRMQAEVDIGGWGIIIGKAGIFVGQNLEKNRIDFEGYIGSKVQIPEDVPIVGGMPLASMFFGVNNDKVWGSVGILFISLGVTYYWGGGLEFGTSGEDLPEGFVHMLVEDPEKGPRLVVIGQGVETLATSWIDTEQVTQEIVYREVADGVKIVENGSTKIGVGGITSTNGGRQHAIPMTAVNGNAIIEVDYETKEVPKLTITDGAGKTYPLVYDNTNTNPNANAFTQHIAAGKSSDGVDSRKAFIIVPKEKATGTWTVKSPVGVETRLLNVPTTPELKETKLTKNVSDPNKFTASWAVANAKPGDKINLYLTEEAVTTQTTKIDNGEGVTEVLEPGDPGLLIAENLNVGTDGKGSTVVDVSEVSLLGDVEDIRGLLGQGNYYLRAELRSDSGYSTKTSVDRIEIVDPLAPKDVTDVTIEPAGNGLFAVSFKPGSKKTDNANFEHSFAFEALSEVGGKLETYPNFGEVLFTEEELAPYWNAKTGKYEGILLGGWNAVSTSEKVDTSSLKGTAMSKEEIRYTGLQVGKEYVLSVAAVTKPTKEADKNENYHFANRVNSAKKLLPVPVKPKLTAAAGSKMVVQPHFLELLTSATKQELNLSSTQKDIEVEAFYAEKSLGKVSFTNNANGSSGKLTLDQFSTDGPYAIELKARNKKTKDVSVTMLYLTVDTIAPTLYIDEPVTGTRTNVTKLENVIQSNEIAVKGTTSNDVKFLLVNDQQIAVADNGAFEGSIKVDSDQPTVALNFVSRDGAGNENTAIVNVTNDAYQVPSALVLELPKVMKPGETKNIVAKLKVAKGKENGKPVFDTIAIPADKLENLSFNVTAGDSAGVSDIGKVTAFVSGATLIEAEYKISDDVTITGMVVADVQTPKQTALDVLKASTSAISGNSGNTKLNVTLPQEMAGKQLVYKLFPKGTTAELPTFEQDLTEWSFVPTDSVVAAAAGDVIVVALRNSLDKKAIAVSAKLSASLWSASGTGPIGPIGPGPVGPGVPGPVVTPPVTTDPETTVPTEPVDITVNGKPLQAKWKGTTAVLNITAKDVVNGELKIKTAAAAKGYQFDIDADVVQQALNAGKTIEIDLPSAKLNITPDMMKDVKGSLNIEIADNNDAAKSSLNKVASGLKATSLGAGSGVTIKTNLTQTGWENYVGTQVAVPAGVKASDITAVVLQGADGNWTTLPWTLDQQNGLVNVRLTGEGSLMFVSSAPAFNDVKKTYWGANNIAAAAEKLFVMGKSSTNFDPEAKVTRAEYPTILLRVAGLMNRDADSTYSDVSESSWYKRSVSIASELGIVAGNGDGSYAPNASLSRMEAMVMVGRTIDVLGIAETLSEAEITSLLSTFEDGASVPGWARATVALTIKHGIILGEKGRINTQAPLNRAQAAAIAVRLNQLINKEQ